MEAVEKNKAYVSAKMAVRQNKIHYYFFQLILFCLTAIERFFSSAAMELLA
jgi:hypothetical protein